MKTFISLLVLSLATVGANAQPVANTDFVEGKHYRVLPQQQPTTTGTKIEVVEAFSYMCPHCFSFQPYLHEWLKGQQDVTLVRLPVALGHVKWLSTAKAYFVAEALGVLEQSHMAMFENIHRLRKDLSDPKEQALFYTDYGISEADYNKALASFAVDTRIKRSHVMARNYQLSGTPTVIINGKYITSPLMAGSMENATRVIDMLVEQERKTQENASD